MPGLADIEQAALRLRGHLLNTPCVESRMLSQLTGAQILLKFENLQYTASFKERGACNKLAQLSADERRRGNAIKGTHYPQGGSTIADGIAVGTSGVMTRAIEEVHHQRAFTMLPAQNVEIELVLQTRGPEHIVEVLETLNAAGFDAFGQR